MQIDIECIIIQFWKASLETIAYVNETEIIHNSRLHLFACTLCQQHFLLYQFFVL